MKSSSTTIDNISPKFRIGLLEIGDVLGEPLISCFSFAFQNSNVLVDLVNVGFKRGFESPDIRGVRTKLLLDSPREYSGPHCLDQKKAFLSYTPGGVRCPRPLSHAGFFRPALPSPGLREGGAEKPVPRQRPRPYTTAGVWYSKDWWSRSLL